MATSSPFGRVLFAVPVLLFCALPLACRKDSGDGAGAASASGPKRGNEPPPPPTAVAEAEPNDDWQHAQALPLRAVVSGEFAPRHGKLDADWFKVSPGAGKTLALQVDLAARGAASAAGGAASAAGGSDSADAGTAAKDADGAAAAGGAALDATVEVLDRDRNSLVRRRAPAEPLTLRQVACAEECFVRVAGASGQYSLSVLAEPLNPGWEQEPNDRAIQATALEPGRTVQGYFGAPDDQDFFRVVVPAPRPGQFLRVEVTGVPGVRGELEVRSLDGALLATYRAPAEGEPIFVRNLAVASGAAQLAAATPATANTPGPAPGAADRDRAPAGAVTPPPTPAGVPNPAASPGGPGAPADTTPSAATAGAGSAAAPGSAAPGASATAAGAAAPAGSAEAPGSASGAGAGSAAAAAPTNAAPASAAETATIAAADAGPGSQAGVARIGEGNPPSAGAAAAQPGSAEPRSGIAQAAQPAPAPQAPGAAALAAAGSAAAGTVSPAAGTDTAGAGGTASSAVGTVASGPSGALAAAAGATSETGFLLVLKSSYLPARDKGKYRRGYNVRTPYTLRAALEAGPPDLELEPNDDPQHATDLGTALARSGFLAPAGDADWYRVHAAAPSVLHVEVTGLEHADLELSVYGAPARAGDKPVLLAKANEGGVREGEVLPAVGIPAGDSFVKVESAARNLDGKWTRDTEDRQGLYHLTATLAADDGSLEREPNDDAAHAQPVTLPASVRGYVWPKKDVDLFQFHVAEGHAPVSARVTAVRGVELALVLRQLSADGKGEPEVIGTSAPAKGDGDRQIVGVPLKAGDYQLEVSSPRRDASATQQYTLTIQ